MPVYRVQGMVQVSAEITAKSEEEAHEKFYDIPSSWIDVGDVEIEEIEEMYRDSDDI